MSDEREQVDVIVVGGGVAGLAAAYTLANEGKEVILIERGSTCGEKNMTGGRVYSYPLVELLGEDLLKEAPLERPIVKEQIVMVDGQAAMTIDYTDFTFNGEIPQSYSILHAVFDPWLAEQAENAGVMMVNGVLVDELIEENGRVVGVRTGDEEMYADLVIAADGVNSFLAQKAGLRGELKCHDVGVGAKEVIELPAEVIAQRFGLEGNEGAARLYVGAIPGIAGGCMMYTNRDTISLGMVFGPAAVSAQSVPLYDLIEEFKMLPSVRPFVEGGKVVEYSGHLVSEAGYNGVLKQPYKPGLVVIGDAAGFVINQGSTIRGIDLAIASGLAAAKAYIANSDGATVGADYKKKLEEVILPTMKVFAGMPTVMEIQRLYKEYPVLANQVMKNLFTVDGKIPEKMPKAVMQIIKSGVGFSALVADGWKAMRSL